MVANSGARLTDESLSAGRVVLEGRSELLARFARLQGQSRE